MYRILLVDDEILVRDAIRENINWQEMDCELVGDCENGKQAAEFVQTHEVDIVLTDILMPFMDGMELSRFLYENYPEIVIVVFSGFGEFEYAKKAIQYNVSEYLLKPVTATELTEVIGRMKGKVDQSRKEKKKMESLTRKSEKYRENEQAIRFRTLENLVNCTTDVQESVKALEEMNIHLTGPAYRVAVFDIDLYSDLYTVDTEKRQESALMAFVLFNISDEIVRRENAGLAYQEGGNRVCVLFEGKPSRSANKKIQDLCREIQQKIKEVMGLAASIGIGGWVEKLDELLLSHDAARDALQYRYLLGGSLLFDTVERHQSQDIYLYHALVTLKAALKGERHEEAEKALSAMEDEICSALPVKSRACMYLQQIVREANSVCENIPGDQNARQQNQEETLSRIPKQKSFEAACKVVREHIDGIFAFLEEANSSSGQRQARMALDYIRENYMNPDLSLNGLCSYLNISTSYFSTIFKELTGETFTEVLIRTRMDKAKELLETTTLKNYEIAEKVGFADPHYFGISFKKMTGCTPTEYAKEKRK